MYNTVSSALDANSYGLMPVSNMPVSNNDNDKQPTTDWSRLAPFVALMQVVLLGLFLRFVQYPTSFSSQDDVQYVFYLNVTIMMLVGFGFLMTFQVSVFGNAIPRTRLFFPTPFFFPFVCPPNARN